MLYFIHPANHEMPKSAFSIGGQPIALLMFHNMARAAGLEKLSYIDESLSSFNTEILQGSDCVFISCNFFNLNRTEQILSEALTVGTQVFLGGPAIEITKGNIRALGIKKHPRLTIWCGGWQTTYRRFAEKVGLFIEDYTWESLSRFQRNRIDKKQLAERSSKYLDLGGLKFQGNLVNFHSRIGCLYRAQTGGCSFCSRHQEYYNIIQPETYVSIVREAINDWGAGMIWDSADSFFESRQELEALVDCGFTDLEVDLMVFVRAAAVQSDIAALLRQCGVRYAVLGLESGSDRILKIANKGSTVKQGVAAIASLTEVGIEPIPCFTLGHPTETEEEIKSTLKLAKQLAANYKMAALYCSPIFPIPGSSYGKLLSAYIKKASRIELDNLQEIYFRKHVNCNLEYAMQVSRSIESLGSLKLAIWGQ